MDFDKFIDRRNTGSIKWDLMKTQYHTDDLLPLWVADMDFQSPEDVIEALTKRAEHGVYGYTYTDDDYCEAIVKWMAERHQWSIKKEWIVSATGVVPAIHFAVQTFTKEGDGVIIQQPVYRPFFNAVLRNKRQLVNSPLIYKEGRYIMDFNDFEQKVIDENVKMFIMCSPHNPVGRVWIEEELRTIGDICIKHGVLVVSDEIHHDIVYPKHRHIPFAGLGEEYADICITCTSPGKTFNLAALQNANIIISNANLRRKFVAFMESLGITEPGIMGMIACKTAYTKGHEWLDSLIRYLLGNKEYARSYIKDQMPNILTLDTEGTYLMWMDFKETGLSGKELDDFLIKNAKVQLHSGLYYGEEGRNFMRLNFACHRNTLVQALDRMKIALKC